MIIKNFKDYLDSINEGLIKTLDGEKAINYLVQTLSLLNFDVSGNFNNDKITFTINNFDKIQYNRLDDLFDTISSIMINLYGWFPSTMLINDKLHKKYDEDYIKLNVGDINKITIEFDSKFDEVQNDKFEKMYHITIQEYDHKIKKYGLFPKSKSKLSSHTDRIYLCKSIEDCEMLIPQMKLYYSEERDTNLYKLNNKKYRKDIRWIIYEISNTSNLKLYKDPRYINGYYNLENINPQDIKEVKRE